MFELNALSVRKPLPFVIGLLGAVALTAACQSNAGSTAKTDAPAAPVTADTWAVVDGQQITRSEVEKAYTTSGQAQPGVSDEEAMVAKLTVLNNLIDQQILSAKAKAQKLEVPQSDVDAAFADAKKNIPDDAFQQELFKRGMTVAELQDSLRRDLLTQKVINQEISSKITVSDQEISNFFNANRAQFNVAEESYHLAQIAVTPVPEQQPTNQTGDDATTPDAAAKKAQMLMERLKAGASFQELAAGYSEDPESAQRGGDIGLVPMSRLMQAPPALRNAVLKKEPGTVTVANVNGAYTLVLVVAHEMPGQRDLASPGVKDQISNALRGRKEQLLRAAYLTAMRSDAKVVNYLARRIVESNGQVPTLGIAAPAAAPAATPSTK